MTAPSAIIDLVSRFNEHRDTYTSPNYNEAQLRQEFLNPFFEALGWDVANKQSYAAAYKEVIHEDAVKVGTATKAPDYSFRIGGVRKFFVEAKKPSVNIKDDVNPAFQLKRYAWSAKLPLSILTDFEEFAVYDCRERPDKNHKASVGRVMYFKYTDYESKWDEIAGIFTKEAIMKGSFDAYASDKRKRQGTAEVDSAFLADIENWRNELAKNIARRNTELTTRELNFAVQRTIDRLIFLRICEDRGIEDYGKLQAHISGDRVYKRLCELFRYADDRYNSGIFHFKQEKGRDESPDNITLNLNIDDKILKDIIGSLYYPESPYEFSVLSADILGQVYEQFLGKVIRLTAGHMAKVEDKPEVKKAGGVFYTPTYIVDYIVKNTVGKLLENKTPKEAAKLRILDPACGSGSFLIGAYQYLLDWHRDWYVNDDADKHTKGKNPTLYKAHAGDYRLTSPERKRILTNNIYGVDIDTQAVEVTKLSLLLKVLEGETEQSISQQLTFLHERALPDLGNNIKCGNSLIGTDFYYGQQECMDLGKDEERIKINAFDWDGKDGFAEIMKAGGFDAVIGNPPYVRQEMLGDFKKYFQQAYKVYQGTADLYVYFFERSHRLLRQNGLFGMICSNKFMRTNYGKALREFLANETVLVQIIDFGELPVFSNAATFPAIFLTRHAMTGQQDFTYAAVKQLKFLSLTEEIAAIGTQLSGKSMQGDNWTLADSAEVDLIEKIKTTGIPLKKYVNAEIYRGVLTGLNEAFVIDEETKNRLIKEDSKSAEIIQPFVVGDDVRKYRINFKDRYLLFIPKGWTNTKLKGSQKPWEWISTAYPAIARHLSPFAVKGEKRSDKGDYWWELRACDYYDEFEKPKIVYPEIAKESRFSYNNDGCYLNKTCFFIPLDDYYLLGVLNSKVVWTFLKRLCSVLGDADKSGRLLQQKIYIETIPIRPINGDSDTDKKLHNQIVSHVTSMLDLNKRLPLAKTEQEKAVIARQIDSTDRRIDAFVYELYGLTEEEIRIVEGV